MKWKVLVAGGEESILGDVDGDNLDALCMYNGNMGMNVEGNIKVC